MANQLGKKRLLIVADGALQYVPFGALPAPRGSGLGIRDSGSKVPGPRIPSPEPLITGHEIISLPSASVLALLRREVAGRKPAPKTLAVLADPVFTSDDPRVNVGIRDQGLGTREKPLIPNPQPRAPNPEPRVPNPQSRTPNPQSRTSDLERALRDVGMTDVGLRIPRLPFSRQEAEGIARYARAAERMKALDFQANRATATSPELAEYRIVHFATHALLNRVHPELSGIVLSLVDERGREQDGFLRLHEIYNLNLPAELVVLSACQTGLGKELKGEGLIGLTRGFMYAGAARVVASLWKVDDVATAELMKRFYQGMLKDRLRPAAALRAAQAAMWREKRWQSPYYWAAFVLQGEWK